MQTILLQHVLPGLTPEYIKQRWDGVLVEARQAELYVQQQMQACQKQSPNTEKYDKQVDTAVDFLRSSLEEVT